VAARSTRSILETLSKARLVELGRSFAISVAVPPVGHALTDMVTEASIMTMSRVRWSIASAKAELSKVVRRAQHEPQVIENRGEPVAVVIGIDEYRRDSERRSRTVAWHGFLERTAAMVAETGGIELEIPPRTTRPDPFATRPLKQRPLKQRSR
jgi:prevent-host-death family protein